MSAQSEFNQAVRLLRESNYGLVRDELPDAIAEIVDWVWYSKLTRTDRDKYAIEVVLESYARHMGFTVPIVEPEPLDG